MAFGLAFVDSISATPTVRLQLHDYNPLSVVGDQSDFGMPELRKARVATMLLDGDFVSGSSFGNRMIKLRLKLPQNDYDARAAAVQSIARELARETNYLRYQQGTTNPVFFPTWNSEISAVDWDGVSGLCTAVIEAGPYGLGLTETGTVTIYNDPRDGTTLNSNPYFETTANPWGSINGATVARNTSQFHEGTASLIITPDGVTSTPQGRSEEVAVTVGTTYQAASWVRATNAMTIDLGIAWFDAGHALLSTTTQSLALAAGTWTYMHVSGAAPASAAFARLISQSAGVVAAANQWRLDEARLVTSGTSGGMYFELSGIKGDADAPLALSIAPNAFSGITVDRRTVIGVRRDRGPTSAMPFTIQAETMTPGTDTTTSAGNDPNASGGGNNFSRVQTWTNALLATRLTADPYPSSPSQSVRGQYRVWARHRATPAGGGTPQPQFQLKWGGYNNRTQINDPVNIDGFVSGTSWGWADLGFVQFPQGADPEIDLTGLPVSVRGMRFELAVSKGAATNVDVDFLLFVPADDLYGVINMQLDTQASALVIDSTQRLAYYTGPSGEVRSNEVVPLQAGLPAVRPGVTNRFVWILDTVTQTGGDQISDYAVVTWSYMPRYVFAKPVLT